MSSGIYTSYSGAIANQYEIEVIANNVANANTSGFKRDHVRFDTVLDVFARAADEQIDLSPGANRLTGSPIHAAINGPGFFAVQSPDGAELFTRRGDFEIGPGGQLTLPNGFAVLGTGGPLEVPAGTRVQIQGDGRVFADGTEVGQLRIVEFEDPAGLLKRGDSTVAATPEAGARDVESPRVAPGFVESSNVNLSAELVALIVAQRSFEASVTSLQINDEMTQALIQAQR